MHYVYVLRNQSGEIVYIGETEHLKARFNSHVAKSGKFPNMRYLLKMETVSEHATRKEAIQAEGQLKKDLDFEWTEMKNWQTNGKKRRKFQPQQIIAIRDFYESGEMNQTEIANYYGVTQTAISRILNKINYNDL